MARPCMGRTCTCTCTILADGALAAVPSSDSEMKDQVCFLCDCSRESGGPDEPERADAAPRRAAGGGEGAAAGRRGQGRRTTRDPD